MDGSTIIGAEFEPQHPLRSILLDQATPVVEPDEGIHRRLFKIRAADSAGRRSSANILVNRMYATRGYRGTSQTEPTPSAFTLMATDASETIGTITIGFDGPQGLLADDLFRQEIEQLRDSGRLVCEFTKLAIDSVVRSRKVLASLFHVAYIWAHRINHFDDLVIEVNPRHALFYQRMLGFTVYGPERLNRRVNAPAVLLRLDFAHAHEQIGLYGGRHDLADRVRSLYPHFFSVREEAGIVGRLLPTVTEEELVTPPPSHRPRYQPAAS